MRKAECCERGNLFFLTETLSQIKEKNYLANEMGCLKLTYSQEKEPTFLKVWKNPETTSQKVDWYDYGGRANYDPQLGRFHSIDPMAVFTPGISPYTYANDNPVLYIDYYGLGIKDWWNSIKDFTMTKVLGFDKHGSHKAGNVYYARNKTRSKSSRSGNTTSSSSQNSSGGSQSQTEPPSPPTFNFTLEDQGTLDENFEIENLYVNHEPILPSFDNRTIKPGTSITFTKRVQFEFISFNFYDIDATEKTLSELVKTLQDWPQLQLKIIGNIWGEPSTSINEEIEFNGVRMTYKQWMENRAGAVLNYLVSKGISPDRLKAWAGNFYSNQNVGQSTSFILVNPE